MTDDEGGESDCCGSGCNPCVLDARSARSKVKHDENVDRERNAIRPESYATFKVASSELRSPYALITFDRCGGDVGQNLYFEAGQYFIVKKPKLGEDDSETSRPYTPLRHPELYTFDGGGKFEPREPGRRTSFQIIARLREGGVASEYLKRLKVGDETKWRGPYGHFANAHGSLLMICQGSAAVPMFSIATAILADEADETRVTLLYCCRGLSNAIFRKQLYEMSSHWNFRYRIFAGRADDGADNGAASMYREPVSRARLTPDDVQTELEALKDPLVLVAGSDEFAESVQKSAKAGKCMRF